METQLLRLENAILRSAGKRRTILTPDEEATQRFGQALFEFLFQGEAGSLFRECQREAAHDGSGVRVKLRVQPPELNALPWEFLFDTRRHDYVCLDPDTPVVRYLDLPQLIRPLAIEPPLRILGMVASPVDLPDLDAETERRRLSRSLGRLQGQGLVELVWIEGQSWRELQRMVRPNRGPWHIFHFIGHGGFDPVRDEGLVMFADETGHAHRISAMQLSRLLARQRASLRMVVLNACEGARGGRTDLFASTAATLVRGGIPAVLAMQYAITDGAAVEFARTFYEALADGLPVDTAVADARNAVNLRDESSLEWGIPVLHMRAPDGRLFTVSQRPPAKQAPSQQAVAPAPSPPVTEPASQSAQREEVRSVETSAVETETVSEEARSAVAERKAPPPINFDWVTIPAGEFLMGSDKRKDKRASDNETPQHTLDLPEYRIARVPVTNAQYQAFIEATGRQMPDHWESGRIPKGNEDHPVVYVSWRNAVAFCEWAGVRLPSEAEWEKAARGTDGRIFPWGDQDPTQELCNFNMNGGDTTAVGRYPKGASPYGVLDMAGNVWEWTSSLFKPYPYTPEDGREDPAADGIRTLRGGSWHNFARLVRCAYRDGDLPYGRNNGIGFRVVSPGS